MEKHGLAGYGCFHVFTSRLENRMSVNQEKAEKIDPKILSPSMAVKEKIAEGSSIPALFFAKSRIWVHGVWLRGKDRGIIFVGQRNFPQANTGKVGIVTVIAAPSGAANSPFLRWLPRSPHSNGGLFISAELT